MLARFARRALPVAIALAAATGGAIVAWHYHRLGLTLSHYDARGHLVVARRIFDSLTPGWQQIGAVWLPLPHLLNALPVQLDVFYRTGASAVAISIGAFAIATGAIAWIVRALTDSATAAIAAACVFALNPNVLYLQSTPMTEPLLLASTLAAIAMLMAWVRDAGPLGGAPGAVGSDGGRRVSRPSTGAVGWAFALACLTRYEAWPVTVGALVAAAWARWRRDAAAADVRRGVASIALYPALAIGSFLIVGRVVGGEWFVASGFFVPENKALGDPMLAAAEVGWAARTLSGTALLTAGVGGAGVMLARGLGRRRGADALVPLALPGMAAIPWAAFVNGHPFRIRYMVPLIAMEAIGAGVLAAAIRRTRAVGALALVALVAWELRPLDGLAPMVLEAQWDRPNLPVRARVTGCLGAPGSGQKIMASMGSLGHYMQEASRAGFTIRDFLHEGNGDIWLAALQHPRPFADWVLIEEKAEGGDMLAEIVRRRPSFLDGYARVCEGAGLALYRRHRAEGKTHKAVE